jgi:hypothetical protein
MLIPGRFFDGREPPVTPAVADGESHGEVLR